MKTETRSIYPKRHNCLILERARLQRSNISQHNKELITQFQNKLIVLGSGNIRVAKLSGQLRIICMLAEKNLDDLTKADIIALVGKIAEGKFLAYRNNTINKIEIISETTKADYKRCLKQFFKQYRDEDKRLESKDEELRRNTEKLYRCIEKDISTSYKKKQIDPTEILTEEDIDKVVTNGCHTPKEKAMVKFLHETGLRAAELLNIRRKDIEIYNTYGAVHVDGKTGRRTTQFVNSMPYLLQWLEMHPDKRPDSYVWLGERLNQMYEPMHHIGATKLIKRCFNRAGLNKRTNLHWFRHSRATILAPQMPEAILCKYMGWVLGSRQVRTYLHLCPQQVESTFLKINGLESKAMETKNLPKKCVCGKVNDFAARYCFVCGKPLSVANMLRDQDVLKRETDKTINEMLVMLQKPEMLKAFMEFKKTIGGN